jgi:uncharacterized membrane protein
MRVASIAVLGLALVLGGYLRFAQLGTLEISADEGASWAAAAEPSFGEVLSAQRRLNPAELGLHDVALHYWIDLFGDSASAMRSLSAAAGLLALALAYTATRELFAMDALAACPARFDEADLIAALAALLMAVNLVTLKYSRELRMYPLMLAMVLAQVTCFLRSARAATRLSYLGAALFTALAIAAHPMALLAFAAEGVWLIYLLVRHRFGSVHPSTRTLFGLFGALAAGTIVAAMAALPMLHSGARAAHGNLINWIPRPPLWAPFALFNKATGSFAFPVIAILAVWGAIRGWNRWPAATVFALLLMWAPPLALMAVSYAFRPLFVERYLLSSFVPLFMLAALGIIELPLISARIAAVILAVALALGHCHEWSRKTHDTQWREGVRIAIASITSGQSISVAPDYAVNAVRYYLGSAPAVIHAYPLGDSAGQILLVADQSKAPGNANQLLAYPHLLAHLRGVTVRSR